MSTQLAECEVPAKWRWHYEVLTGIRDRLLRARKRGLQDATETAEWHTTDPTDRATDEVEQDLTMTLLTSEIDALYEVEAALSRIEDGSYGICEMTGKTIPAARLRAVPWARNCRAAAEEILEKPSASRMGTLNVLHFGAVVVGEEATEWQYVP